MLIDDDSSTNFLHQATVELTGITDHVSITRNGIEALSYLNNNTDPNYRKPSIIFLDINMPRMDGFQFLEEYNKLDDSLKAEVVFVMLTSSALEEDEQRAIEMGVHEYITKPLTENHIINIYNKHFKPNGNVSN